VADALRRGQLRQGFFVAKDRGRFGIAAHGCSPWKEWNPGRGPKRGRPGGAQSAAGRVAAPAPDRRLLAVNTPPVTPAANRPTSPSATRALPLSQLLGHAADAVQAVRGGESLTTPLERCPAP